MTRNMRRRRWIWAAVTLAALLFAGWNERRVLAPGADQQNASVVTSPITRRALPASEPVRPGGMRPRQDPYAGLPEQARQTLRLIRQGGPYPYRQDGGVFQNREGNLPQREYGYYREYTVDTPGSGDRGARRIVSGGHPPREFWYTDDHYRSFRRLPPQ